MTTFVWRELTVSVGEMSRAAALTCTRQLDAVVTVVPSYEEMLVEADALLALNAPAIVRFNGSVLDKGTRELQLGDDTVKLTLPLTREALDGLPYTLAQAWTSAAIQSNGWFIENLKKVLSLTSTPINEPKSGGEPSNEQPPTSPPMKTTGE